MFKITGGKGFQMVFANGWTVSVQFGSGNYCENQSLGMKDYNSPKGESHDAEIAAWDANDNWHSFIGDTVKGRCKTDEVAEFIVMIAKK